jgi:hypothetical protein
MMPSQEAQSVTYFPPDLTVEGSSGDTILIAKVRTRLIYDEAEVLEQLISYLQSFKEKYNKDIPFVMFANREKIDIYSWGGGHLSPPLITLETNVVLKEYDPEFEQTDKRVSEYYAETLIEAWLKDLIDEWKTENPPYKAELEEKGILEKLKKAAQGVTR